MNELLQKVADDLQIRGFEILSIDMNKQVVLVERYHEHQPYVVWNFYIDDDEIVRHGGDYLAELTDAYACYIERTFSGKQVAAALLSTVS